LHRLDDDVLELVRELDHLGGAVELAAVLETPGPREDRGDRVGGGRLALLVLTEMPRDRAVRRLRLTDLAVRGEQHRGHQAQRAEALGHSVGLDVAVVVLTGPNVAALPLDGGGHHVVDEAVLVGDAGALELGPELPVEHLLEDVLERAVVGLEDGVLGGQVHRVAVLQSVVERGAREVLDGFGEVVHPHHDAALLGHIDDLVLDGLRAVCRRVGDGDLAGAGDAAVGGPVLVAERVTADDDRLGPARDVPRHVRDDDRGAEDRPAQDVADGAVGRAVHPREPELLHARPVGGDGGALDAHPVLLDRVGGVDRDPVIGGVTVLDAEVVVLEVHIQVRMDELVLDELPDDAGHLVAVQLDYGPLDPDLRHRTRFLRPAPTGPAIVGWYVMRASSYWCRRVPRVALRHVPLVAAPVRLKLALQAGHEFQRQAPARWTATLHRGGVP